MPGASQRRQVTTYEINPSTFVEKLKQTNKRLRSLRRDRVFGTEIVGVAFFCETDANRVDMWLKGACIKVVLKPEEVEGFADYVRSLGFEVGRIKKRGVTFIPDDLIICAGCNAPTVFARMDEELEWRRCLRCGGLMVIGE